MVTLHPLSWCYWSISGELFLGQRLWEFSCFHFVLKSIFLKSPMVCDLIKIISKHKPWEILFILYVTTLFLSLHNFSVAFWMQKFPTSLQQYIVTSSQWYISKIYPMGYIHCIYWQTCDKKRVYFKWLYRR